MLARALLSVTTMLMLRQFGYGSVRNQRCGGRRVPVRDGRGARRHGHLWVGRRDDACVRSGKGAYRMTLTVNASWWNGGLGCGACTCATGACASVWPDKHTVRRRCDGARRRQVVPCVADPHLVPVAVPWHADTVPTLLPSSRAGSWSCLSGRWQGTHARARV